VRIVPLDELAISVVTVEEILRGVLDAIRQSQMKKQYVVEAYEELRVLYSQLYRFTVLPFTSEAERVFDAFPASIKRAGVNDCRIAAIAIAHGCTVVTANTQHFSKIPGSTIEDWTRE
jgi:tRNA(fMet)-specific endonuclease VapC